MGRMMGAGYQRFQDRAFPPCSGRCSADTTPPAGIQELVAAPIGVSISNRSMIIPRKTRKIRSTNLENIHAPISIFPSTRLDMRHAIGDGVTTGSLDRHPLPFVLQDSDANCDQALFRIF